MFDSDQRDVPRSGQTSFGQGGDGAIFVFLIGEIAVVFVAATLLRAWLG